MKFFSNVLLMGLWLLLSGCNSLLTHTVYHHPVSAEGRVCTSQCANAQQQCQGQKDAQHRECEYQHRYAQDSYDRCKTAGGKDCRQPPSCSYTSYYACENNYKSCFGACGGTMEELPGL